MLLSNFPPCFMTISLVTVSKNFEWDLDCLWCKNLYRKYLMFFFVRVSTPISNIKALKKNSELQLNSVLSEKTMSYAHLKLEDKWLLMKKNRKQKIKQYSTYYRTRKKRAVSDGIHFLTWECQPNHCNFIEAAKRLA